MYVPIPPELTAELCASPSAYDVFCRSTPEERAALIAWVREEGGTRRRWRAERLVARLSRRAAA